MNLNSVNICVLWSLRTKLLTYLMEIVHGLIVLRVEVLKMDALLIIRFDANIHAAKAHANSDPQSSCGYVGSCMS
jgi:hypothetical protein